jgi:DNA-binding LacI/PurR family transcriptional regulator
MDRKSGLVRLHVAIVVDVAETFFRDVVAGAAQYGREVGDWQLELVQGPPDAAPLGHWRGRGLIACLNDKRVAKAVQAAGVPLVAVGSVAIRDSASPVPHVDTDNQRLAGTAFEHLRERGLVHFGYYGTVPQPSMLWSTVRGDFFAAAAAAAGYGCSRLHGRDADCSGEVSRAASCMTGSPGSRSPWASWPAATSTRDVSWRPADPWACGCPMKSPSSVSTTTNWSASWPSRP